MRIFLTDRTTLQLSDEQKRLIKQASQIVASGSHDDPLRSDVSDAALTQFVNSAENTEDACDEVDPETIQHLANTNVLALHYRTNVDSRWRSVISRSRRRR